MDAAPDLTQRPPRGPRVRIGGLVLLARVLDKCRATIAGRNGEYTFNCPLDQQFFAFFEADAQAFKKEVGSGAGDYQMFEWVRQNARAARTDLDLLAWSDFQERRAPGDTESRAFFNELHAKAAPHRKDVATWFDLLDLDDHVTFGGKA